MSLFRTSPASRSDDVIQYVGNGSRIWRRRRPASPIGPFPHIARRRIPNDHDPKESVRIVCRWEVRKYVGDWKEERFAIGDGAEPYEIVEGHSNLFVYGGSSLVWECLLGRGTGTLAQPLTYMGLAGGSTGVAYLAVGSSSTAESATVTALVTESKRIVMDATYPQHTDATGNTPAAATVTWQATFGTADANVAWNEWGLLNASATGRLLNRRMPGAGVLGTKSSGQTWVFQVTTTLA